MRARTWFVTLAVVVFSGCVATSCTYEYLAQQRSADLWARVQKCAPVGRVRAEVEQALQSEGLKPFYGKSENIIVGHWIPVGRYRLAWETQFNYRIQLDSSGRVESVKTQLFNEGL